MCTCEGTEMLVNDGGSWFAGCTSIFGIQNLIVLVQERQEAALFKLVVMHNVVLQHGRFVIA